MQTTLLRCTVALSLCTCQLFAQQGYLKLPGSGPQAYHPIKKWRGLDLQSYLRGIGLYGGFGNTATGTDALINNTSGSYNTADGFYALLSNTTGSGNTASGYAAMINNNSGNYKTAIGSYAMELGSSESSSVAVGYFALYSSNATYGYNTAIGNYALYGSSSTGSYNAVCGAYGMYNNTTGSVNTVAGYNAMYTNSTGGENSTSGAYALYYNQSGSYNVANGYLAMYGSTTGSYNVGDGSYALSGNVSGTYITAVGFSSGASGAGLTNATALGSYALVSSSNSVEVGNPDVTSIGGYANWTNFSDGRYKKNIQQNVPGLAFINKLTPITYTLDIDGIESKLHQNDKSPLIKDLPGKPNYLDDPAMQQAMKEKSAVTYTGFVAQDVEKAADSLGFTFSGIDKPKDANQSFYGLRYADFVVPLVKAAQELSASSNSKDSAINVLQNKYDSLQTQVNELRALVLAKNTSAMSGASLDQNSPNPFTGSTTIGYSLPTGTNSAKLQITDVNGNVLGIIPLSGSGGKNTVTASLSGQAAGTYMYSLIVNGKLVGTRQMIAVR
jgi:hypothetical protein